MSTPLGATPPLRIGNQEREAATASLDTHLQAGRLDAEEYGDRYAKAAMAHTRDELDALFLDLPAPHPFIPPSAAAAHHDAWSPRLAPQWQRYVPVTPIGRIAAALVVVAAAGLLVPLFAVWALLWFVAIPVLTGHGHGHRHLRHRACGGSVWR